MNILQSVERIFNLGLFIKIQKYLQKSIDYVYFFLKKDLNGY
jgi:hypothetical protein